MLSPEYACERELLSCVNHDWYTPITTQQYIDQIMLHKPQYLQKDDFIDYLYKEIAADSSVRPTLSMIQFTDLHLDLDYMPGSSKAEPMRKLAVISLGIQNLAATVKTVRADVMTQVHFTGRRLNRGGRRGQKVVSTVHATLGGGFLVLLNGHSDLLNLPNSKIQN